MRFLLITAIACLLSVAAGLLLDFNRVIGEGVWTFELLLLCAACSAAMQGWAPRRQGLQLAIGIGSPAGLLALLWLPSTLAIARAGVLLLFAILGTTAAIRLWIAGRRGLQN